MKFSRSPSFVLRRERSMSLRDLRNVGRRADAILLGLFRRLLSADIDKWVLVTV